MAQFLEEFTKQGQDFVMEILKEADIEIKKIIDETFANFRMYEKTGDKKYLFADFKDEREKLNETKDESAPVPPTKSGRAKRGALPAITETNPELLTVKIKREKVSMTIPKSAESVDSLTSNIENLALKEEMPAPRQLPPRKRKIKTESSEVSRCTRSKNRLPTKEEIRESDLVIQNTTFPTIDITEDFDKSAQTRVQKKNKNTELANVETDETEQPVRTTRTKTIRNKRNRCEDANTSINQAEKKSKSVSPEKNPSDDFESKNPEEIETNKSGQTEYEDAISSLENDVDDKPGDSQNKNNVNATFSVNNNINATYVTETIKGKTDAGVNALVTPDAVKTNIPIFTKKKTKEIFSPYEKSSTKKKVEAFEKLQSNVLTPVENSKRFDSEMQIPKSKVATPMSKPYSSAKVSRKVTRCETPGSSNTENLFSTKSQSALKASQAEFREREMKRQEKEREALKKREAYLQALSENRRKKREEKMMKAQQQRELLEKENLKKMEAQKIKQEKYLQSMAEKEERLKQQRDQSEKKRLLVKKQAEELKEKREDRHGDSKYMGEMKSSHVRTIPLYMVTPAPLLPTDDCYDSDDSNCRDLKLKKLPWSTDNQLKKMQLAMLAAGEKITNTFFSRQIHSPNLQDIFETIDPKKLKRTSSAVWKKPPRYTLFSDSSRFRFSEEEGDDEVFC